MVTELEYSVMATRAYHASGLNILPLPAGWQTDNILSAEGSDGFAASVFVKSVGEVGEEVVVSFRGTNDEALAMFTDFWEGNIPAARGTYSSQVMQAIQRVADVQAKHPGATISFTGHSLGGGLAAVMAVFFDLQAKTFDAAPFGLTAQNLFVPIVQIGLLPVPIPVPLPASTLRRYFDGYLDWQRQHGRVTGISFTQYYTQSLLGSLAVPYAQRSANVSGSYLQGEVLSTVREYFPVIGSAPAPVDIGATTLNESSLTLSSDGIALHSIELLVAMMASDPLQMASTRLPTLLELIRDDGLYARKRSNEESSDFLFRMLADQVPNGENIPGKALDKFAADLLKLSDAAGPIGVAQTNPALRDALMVAAIEYYYFKDLAQATNLFDVSGGGIHFKYSDISPTLLQPESLARLQAAVAAMLTPTELLLVQDSLRGSAWHVQSGGSPLSWDAGNEDVENDVAIGGDGLDQLTSGGGSDTLIGGAGNDSLNGGDDTDTLVGGSGADTLDGGADNDHLVGGAGQDTYQFTGAWGNDTVVDADHSGVIWAASFFITGVGAKKTGTNTWRTDDMSITYTVVDVDGVRTDLFIRVTGSSYGSITIRNWSDGWLGISLGSEVAAPPVTNPLAGDIEKAISEDEESYLITPNGYQSAGPLAGAADVINGTAGNDTINGYGGNDGIAGGDGDDIIDGGDGNDLLLGGRGADTILGGAGNDEIFGSDQGHIDRPTSTSFTPPEASGVERLRGFSWVVYDPPGAGSYVVAGGGNVYPNGETVSNTIDAGAGDDHVSAGTGDDVVHGGDGTDVLWGMGGDDILYGDAGDDSIDGDGTETGFATYTPNSAHGADVLIGGAGNDQMWGRGGSDLLIGGDDNDSLWGDDPNTTETPPSLHDSDELFGGAGNDTLWGGGGADQMYGGAGNDHLEGDQVGLDAVYQGDDLLDGGAGNDEMNGDGGSDTLFGGDGADTLFGDSTTQDSAFHGRDLLDGGAGDDSLVGGGNADTLFGGEGDDTLLGDGPESLVALEDQGDDHLEGGAGDDDLQGNGGNDVLLGGLGKDGLFGGDGNDTLVGGADADFLDGGAGDDTYVIGLGDATISPEGFAENIRDFSGNNVLRIEGVSSGNTVIGQGVGELLVGLGGGQVIAVDFGSRITFSFADGDFSFDQLIGARSNQVISWTEGLQTHTHGGLGSDVITAIGNATVSGGHGNDELTGTGGNNTYLYNLGDGTDRIVDTSAKVDGQGNALLNTLRFQGPISSYGLSLSVAAGALRIETGGVASDAVLIDGFNAADAASFNSVDRFEFQGGLTLTYAELLQRGFDLEGTSGDDAIVGTSVNDRIVGGAGNDTMTGGAGADIYYWGAGLGNDVVDNTESSGQQIDTLRIQSGIAPTSLTFLRSADSLVISNSATSEFITVLNHFTTAPIDQVAFDDGTVWDSVAIAAHLSSVLTNGNDVFTGSGGDDIIAGLGGNDTISGANGNDTIDGGDGNDNLNGGAADDTLIGGAGADVLTGGLGADTYKFGRGDAADQIVESGDLASNDLIRLGLGIAVTDVKITRTGNDLVLSIVGTSDQLRVVNAWASTSDQTQRIERVEFADGTVWAEAELRAALATPGNDTITGWTSNDELHGLDGNDQLNGGGGNDILHGDDGDDTLRGDAGDDTLIGGAGFDTLYGGAGSDTFMLGATPGSDTIYADDSNPASSDRIVFDASVNPVLVQVSHPMDEYSFSPDDLTLLIPNPVQAQIQIIHVKNYFTNGGVASVDEIRFSDGTVWTQSYLRSRLTTGTDAGESLSGFTTNDVIDGLGGDDSIRGNSGDDVISGGEGNDGVNAGYGNDDVSGSNGNDRLYGDQGDDLVKGDSGNDLVGGQDGNDTLYGGAGIDDLSGGAGSDILDGGTGNDVVAGGGGDDIFRYARGDGRDVFSEFYAGGGSDRIQFAAGIAEADVTLSIDGRTLLILLDGNTQSEIEVDRWLDYQIETFEFSTGAIWDLAGITARATAGTPNSMTGTSGDDVFIVDSHLDTISEGANQGADTVQSSVNWTLGANLENLTLVGTMPLRGTGNSLANVLRGNLANNLLNGMQGADTLIGGAGDDTYVVDGIVGTLDIVQEAAGEGYDTLLVDAWSATLPANVEHLIARPYTGGASISWERQFIGNDLDNVIDASGISESFSETFLDGGAGADMMVGSRLMPNTFVVDNVADLVIVSGGGGNDTVLSSVTYSLAAGIGHLTLTGSLAINGFGNDLGNNLSGADNIAANVLSGGVGDDYYTLGDGDTVVESEGGGADTVVLAVTTQQTFVTTSFANVERFRLADLSGSSNLTGSGAAEDLTGNASGNVLEGGGGNDVLDGRGGNDVLNGGSGNDILHASSGGSDVLDGGDGDDRYDATGAQKIIFGRSAGNDTADLAGGNVLIQLAPDVAIADLALSRGGAALIIGIVGDPATLRLEDYFATSTGNDIGTGSARVEFASGRTLSAAELVSVLYRASVPTEENDWVLGTPVSDTVATLGGDDVIFLGSGADAASGGAGADEIHGEDGNDTLDGGADDDRLYAGAGDDQLTGGQGNDELRGSFGADVYRFDIGWGSDVVADIDPFVVPEDGSIDAIAFGAGIAPAHIQLSVESSINLLITSTIDGSTILVLNFFGWEAYGGPSDHIEELRFADGTVWDLAEIRSRANQMIGTEGDDVLFALSSGSELYGLGGQDELYGADGADLLDGGADADSMQGFAGDDVYFVDNAGDAVTEDASSGLDQINSTVTFALGANVENLTLTGSGVINGTGNTAANTMVGNIAANVLNAGTAGADTLIGGGGNDTYVIDHNGVTVIENADEGVDLVQSAVAYVLGANVENLTLTGTGSVNGTGNALANLLTGNNGTNTLDGGAGDDTLVGGSGNDIYILDSVGDVVTEGASAGTDTIRVGFTYSLASVGNVESLTLTGTSAINGTGNSGNNVITGNSAANTLNAGTAGTDTLIGGAGDDTYVVDHAGVTVTESASEGTDAVQSTVTFTLGANVENLTLTGAGAVNGTGNVLANVLTGNSGNNTLTGGDGNDTLYGGSAGTDVLVGGLGNDTYTVDRTSGVTITESASQGTDLVNASATHTLAANVENLTLTGTSAINGTGNTANNVVTGNSGNNTLNAGTAGTDALIGGAGNDTYVINHAGVTVTENAGEGTDLVQSTIAHTLGANLENLTLTGSSAVSGTGNALANVLTGNSGNNTLTGGDGNDTLYGGSAGTDVLVGGLGSDTYTVDRTTGITVTEAANAGTDVVNSSVTLTAAANIEALFLTGSSAINGTGNTLANLLRGNTGNNTLTGGGGNDILEGGGGTDVLSNSSGNTLLNGGAGTDTLTGSTGRELFIGGTGNDAIITNTGADLIVFNRGDGQDTVAASTNRDNVVSIGGGALYADLLFQKVGNDLVLKVGASDQITFTGYYTSTSNRSVDRLQMVIEGTTDYLPGSGNVTRDNTVETFNFEGLVVAFDAARVANPGLTTWALTNALASQYLTGSDTAAIGGDLAYRYNRFGTLSDISFTPAQSILGNAGFVTGSQALQGTGSLQDSTPRLG